MASRTRRLPIGMSPEGAGVTPAPSDERTTMTMTDIETSLEERRSQRLKAATRATHDVLDKTIMAGDIFASRENFAKFLRVQYRFHRDIDALYASPELAALLPDLTGRRRLPKIAHDLDDLGQSLPAADDAPRVAAGIALPTALGWLYVAEGSNVGGSILYKLAVQRLGLDGGFGARHLATHPDGVARHWREFTGALDEVRLSPGQEAETIRAAEEAFATVHGYVAQEFALA